MISGGMKVDLFAEIRVILIIILSEIWRQYSNPFPTLI